VYEYQGRLSWLLRSVIHKVQVVMYDPQGASEGVMGGLALGLPHGMVLASRVVCCRLWTITVEVLGWML